MNIFSHLFYPLIMEVIIVTTYDFLISIVYDTHSFHITFKIQYNFESLPQTPIFFRREAFFLLNCSLFSYFHIILHDSYSKNNEIFIVHVVRLCIVYD